MKLVFFVYVLTHVVCLRSEAKTFTRCGLVRELRRHNFTESEMRNWVCLIEHESGRRTDVIGPPNSDGSRDHGLFQINDHLWCNDSNVPGKDCHATCAELRSDDITKACQCARLIFSRQGFYAWYGWINHCKGKSLPDISACATPAISGLNTLESN